MTLYEDDALLVDEAGLTVKSYGRPGSQRAFSFEEIQGAELIDLEFGTGKYRLVGISPGRLRTFFHWDRARASKPVAISLNIGKRLRRAISPRDPHRVLEIIEAKLTAGR